MSVTIANIVSYFTPAEGLSEEFARLPIRKKLPFCDFHDSEISPPRHQNGRVTFAVHLFSCKVLLTFEDAENFAQEDGLARVKRGTTLQFLDCSVQKRGNLYEYALLTAGAGEVKFTFRTAYAKLRGIIPSAEFICKRLANKEPRGERRGAEVGVSKVRGRRRTIRWRAMPQFRPPRRAGKGARGMPQSAYYAASLKFSSIAVKSNLTGVKIYSQSSMTIARVCAGKPEKIGIFSSSLSCSPSKCSKR